MNKMLSLVSQHNQWRKQCVNLIASENVMSPLCEKMYVSDLMHRYAEGITFHRYYRGLKFVDQIEDLTQQEFKKHFGANFAELRPISGTIANYAAFSAISQRGDNILSLGIENGSHVSHEEAGAAGFLGLKVEWLEYNDDCTMNVERSVDKILKNKPRFIVIGGSVILFPQPIKELRAACDKVGAKIIYDAAHVLGLISAGIFQDPLREGADLITTSTHKTFPGPQGGMILGNVDEPTQKMIQRRVFPGFSSNHHLHRVPSLYCALKEMQEFGKDYAGQIVKNAQALAGELANLGFNVLAKDRGFTQSHQVLVNCGQPGSGQIVSELLERANIILNKNIIPGDGQDPRNPRGIRIGVQEMTRFGMKEPEMKQIAKFIKEIALDKRNPEEIGKEVSAFRNGYQTIGYCSEE
ncbi:MAG: serine hydroxymethyltransferase [Candidatus Paceibacterota bacterium]|jgi:glycine hydroxymethyltransferase